MSNPPPLEASVEKKIFTAAIIGYGEFGRLHARKYGAITGVEVAAIVEPRLRRQRLARQDFPHANVFAVLDDLVSVYKPDIASVTAPATLHYAIAKRCLYAGIHILVEKPLTVDPAEASELLHLAVEKQLIIQPGHLERFNHTLDALRARFPKPHRIEARRVTRWNGRGGDVDVVMDLMVHDIDLTVELFKNPVVHIQAHGAKILTQHWDIVNAELTFADGEIAKLTAARVGLRPERSLKVCGQDARAVASIDNGVMMIHYYDETSIDSDICYCRHEDPLAVEIQHFVDSVRYSRPPLVSPADGYRAVDIAKRIADAVQYDEQLHTLATTDSCKAGVIPSLSQPVV